MNKLLMLFCFFRNNLLSFFDCKKGVMEDSMKILFTVIVLFLLIGLVYVFREDMFSLVNEIGTVFTQGEGILDD